MALTKVQQNLSSTPSIIDNGNATAITIDSSENIVVAGTLSNSSYLYADQNWVTGQINNLVASAPGALNTLNELAAAMGDDANFSTTVTASIATKLPLAGGTMTGNLAITAHDPKITITDNTSSTRAWSIGVGGSADNAFEIIDVTGSSTLLKSTPGSKTVLRPDGNEFHMDSSAGNWFKAYESSNNLHIQNKIQDGNIIIGGMDGSSAVTALSFDMANGGPATFGNDVYLADSRKIAFGGSADFSIYHDGNVTNILRASGTNHDIHFLVNDDGSANLVALKIDASAAGSITTNHDITMSSGMLVLKNAGGDSSGLKLYQGSSDHAYITNNYSGYIEIGTVNNSKKIVLDTSGDLTWNDGAAAFTNSTSPFRFFANSNAGTYNRTVMYAHQNNTSGNMNNGIHFEMGRLTDSSSAEQRAFIVGARGGQSSFKVLDQQAGITQADGDYLVRMYEHADDGFLSLYTGEGTPVERTRITSYGQSWVRSLGVGDGASAQNPPTGAYITIDSAGDNTPLISMIQSNARLAAISAYYSSQESSNIALWPPEGSTDKTAEPMFYFHGQGQIKIKNTGGTIKEFLANYTGSGGNSGFVLGGVSATATNGTGNIHSIHFIQSGKITWGDWTDGSALGMCEGSWNQEGTDRDYLSIHHRNSMNWYGNSNGQTLSMATGGGMSIKGTLTQSQFSDIRLKRDIVPLESVLDKVNSLDVFNFNYMDPDTGEVDEERNKDTGQIGLSAQQTEELFPQVVRDAERIEGDNTVVNRHWKYLDYDKMTPILVKALQEQQTIIEDLKSRIETLEG